ncbi:MAG: TatD family hydrolase [Candidatus Omnitrophica bacterium]|nr:TatD family hydrolase [Candidatus Omnitrophota bacterium]
MLIDTHCHLDFEQFSGDRQAVIRRAKEAGVGYFVNIGATLDSSAASCELAAKYPDLYASVGVHPHDANSFKDDDLTKLKELAARDKVVAIGETGLDYFRNLSSPEDQKRIFASQIELAKSLDLPLVVHTRQAEDQTLKILKAAMPLRAVVHCFSGDENFLRNCLELGFFISFTCNITYKKAQTLREMVKLTPLDKLMLETDAPYLAPEGFRGKRNEPSHIKLLAEEVSRIKGVSFEEVAQKTTGNAKLFFKLK